MASRSFDKLAQLGAIQEPAIQPESSAANTIARVSSRGTKRSQRAKVSRSATEAYLASRAKGTVADDLREMAKSAPSLGSIRTALLCVHGKPGAADLVAELEAIWSAYNLHGAQKFRDPAMAAPKFRNEAALQRALLERLSLVPRSLWMRNSVGGRRDCRMGLGPGSADIIGLYNGQFVAIEVKMPGETLAPAQMAWSAWVSAAGGVTWVARSLQDIEGLLARLEDRC